MNIAHGDLSPKPLLTSHCEFPALPHPNAALLDSHLGLCDMMLNVAIIKKGQLWL